MATPPKDRDDVSTVHRQRLAIPAEPAAAFVVDVTEGRDRGARFLIDTATPSPVLVGTSQVCALRLTDPEVSRRHFAMEIAGRQLVVSDLGSTNGTAIDGVSILAARVRAGQSVRIGSTTIQVTRTESSTHDVVPDSTRFGRFIGASDVVRRLYPIFARLAASNVSVLVEGETGAGKEVLAEALHEMGPRAEGAFVVLDCSALSGEVEAELFGVDPAAGAPRRGLFEQADGGTLLIDDIGALDPALQRKLLRAVERSEVTPLGGERRVRFDARIIVTTSVDLDRAVQEGAFREDLYHRIAVARIELPPLRRRVGDVALLARAFATELGDDALITPERLARLEERDWPGNVRELKNAIARLAVVGDALAPANRSRGNAARPLEDFVAQAVADEVPLTRGRAEIAALYDRLYVELTLAKHNGNVLLAANAAGLARRYFQLIKNRK